MQIHALFKVFFQQSGQDVFENRAAWFNCNDK